MSHAGELAALGTSLGFTLGPTFFSLAGRRVGSQVVNRIRLLGAAPLLVLLHFALTGAPLPAFDATRWLWLALSGLVGLVAGDACLFRAFVLIGPRLTMLVYSLNPLIAALLARVLFGERLGPLQVLAMAVTLAGVGWVVSERQPRTGAQGAAGGSLAPGLLLALGGGAGQALGLVFARQGLGDGLPALSAHVLRMCAAAVGIWILALAQRQVRLTFRRLREQPRALGTILGGMTFGPVAGVWLAMVAIARTELGVASTLMALPPIFLLPVGRFVFRERVGVRAVAGTLLAVAGAVALFLL